MTQVVSDKLVNNYDKGVMDDRRKLRPHPAARLSDAIPPVKLLAKYIIPDKDAGAAIQHLFWVERRPLRGFDDHGQATFRWHDRTYNVVRALLQHRLGHRIVRAANACGLPQCVKLEHWTVEPSFLGAVTSTTSGLATVKVGGAWRLSVGGVVSERDVVFVGRIQAQAKVTHVIRALREDNETLFVTVCSQVADPAEVVAVSTDATCPGCVS